MKTTPKVGHETIEDLVRRCYTVRWTDGREEPARLECAVHAVRDENPDFEQQKEIRLPELPGLPFLTALITNPKEMHSIIHGILECVQADPRLLALSFIDPLRLGCEELGIAATPEMAAQARVNLHGLLSFDQERYVEVRDKGGTLRGITSARWVPKSEGGRGAAAME